jgi:hypothetical protein
MAFLRIRSHHSEWKSARKEQRRAVEDALARADQEQRQAWVDATWTPEMLNRLDADVRSYRETFDGTHGR